MARQRRRSDRQGGGAPGLIVHHDLRRPFAAVEVPAAVQHVLMVLHDGPAVVEHLWLAPRPTITAAHQQAAVERELGWLLRRRQARAAVTAALGGPAGSSETGTSVSVIVCTRDRPDALAACLHSLLALRRPVELLVVDSAPRGRQAEAVCAELGVTYLHEALPGQSRARNRGITAVSGELVAFTDDDVVVAPEWLDHIEQPFADPLTMVATGYVGPLELRTAAQVLFERNGGFARHSERRVFGDLTPLDSAAHAGAGANMVLRRSALAEVGMFDEAFGPGTANRSAGDKVMFYEVLRAGYRIDYDPARVVWHRHREQRAGLRRQLEDRSTGEIAWTARALVTHHDTAVVTAWRASARQGTRRLGAALLGRRQEVPAWITLAQLRGVARLPRRPASTAARLDRRPTRAPTARVLREPPCVSVAVASYNRRERLRGSLSALARQSMPAERYEVVVVLDGSTDGSAAMVRGLDLPVPVRLVEQPNRGLAAARNVGWRSAGHPVVLFLDDDINAAPELVAAHAAHHATGAATLVLGHFPPVIDAASWWQRQLRAWWSDHFRRKARRDHVWAPADVIDGNSSVPRTLLAEVGGFDEDFTGGRRQDYDLGVRLLRRGAPLAFAADAHGDHHLATGLRASWANARAEGRYDVLLAVKHPGAPVAGLSVTPEEPSVALDMVGRPFVLAGLEQLARALERQALWAPWWRLVVGLGELSYRAGVRDGLAAYGAPRPRDPPAAPSGEGDLRAPRPAWTHAPEPLRLRPAGLTPVTVGELALNVQWDWDHIVNSAVAALAATPAADDVRVRSAAP